MTSSQPSHPRTMVEPEDNTFDCSIIPPKVEHKPDGSVELKESKSLMSSDVDHGQPLTKSSASGSASPLQHEVVSPPSASLCSKFSSEHIAKMKSIIQEMTEDFELLIIDKQIGFMSWSKEIVHPKVVMYQTREDKFRIPWLYLPIPPYGYSWICHHLASSFEKSDYVYIPEIKCSIASQALKNDMTKAFKKKKPVVFDVKGQETSDVGKLYFFPDLPTLLICGPFKTNETTINPTDIGNVDKIAGALQHMDHLKGIGDKLSRKQVSLYPRKYAIKKRTDNETKLSVEESKELFAKLYPEFMDFTSARKRAPPSQFRQQTFPAPEKVRKIDCSDEGEVELGHGGSSSNSASSTNSSKV